MLKEEEFTKEEAEQIIAHLKEFKEKEEVLDQGVKKIFE